MSASVLARFAIALCIAALCGLPGKGVAQSGLLLEGGPAAAPAKPVSLYERANTAHHEAYFSEAEKTVILLINLARQDGAYFARHYLTLARDTTAPGYTRLKTRLLSQQPAPALLPAMGLARSSQLQARDMGQSGATGTTSSEGEPFYSRIHQQLPGSAAYASGFYLGSGDPLDIVLGLLLGEGADTSAVYQRMLLAPQLDLVGVAIRPHKRQCSNTVIDFARRPPQLTQAERSKRQKKEAYFLDCPSGTKVQKKRKGGGNLFGWKF